VFGDLGDVPSAVAYHSEWNPITMRGEREARFLSRLRDKVHLARIPNYQKGAGIKLSFSIFHRTASTKKRPCSFRSSADK
jgi:hypothetical protein